MIRKKSRLIRAVTAGVFALAMLPMAGCQKPDTPVSDTDVINVAVIVKNMNSTYWNSVWNACDDLEQEFGTEVKITRMGPSEETAEAQMKEIENAISQNVDAIVLAACDPDAENETLAAATAAGIPIITIDSDVTYGARTCYLGTMNDNAARAAARYTADLLNGEGTVGIIYHGDVASTATERRNIFIDYLSGNTEEEMPAGAGSKPNNTQSEENGEEVPEIDEEGNPVAEEAVTEAAAASSGIKIINTLNGENDWEVSKQQARKLITEDHVDIIFGTNSKGTWAGCVAVEELIAEGVISQGEVHVVGFDYFDNDGKNAKQYFDSGILSATIVQNPYNMGYIGVRYAMDVVNGLPVPSVVDTGVTVVTVDNWSDSDVQFLIGNNTTK